MLKCDLCKYSKSNLIQIRLNRVNRYRPHTVAHQCHHFGMHRHSLIAVVPETLKPSCFAFDAHSPISTERIQWVQRTQQTNSMHQIVQFPFQNRNQTYLCSHWLVWYFDQLRFHIYRKKNDKSKIHINGPESDRKYIRWKSLRHIIAPANEAQCYHNSCRKGHQTWCNAEQNIQK